MKKVTIEARNFGLRSKTWSCLVLGWLAGFNFLIACLLWPVKGGAYTDWGLSGYLTISTIAFTLAVISEIRRKKGVDEIQQIIVKQENEIPEA